MESHFRVPQKGHVNCCKHACRKPKAHHDREERQHDAGCCLVYIVGKHGAPHQENCPKEPHKRDARPLGRQSQQQGEHIRRLCNVRSLEKGGGGGEFNAQGQRVGRWRWLELTHSGCCFLTEQA